MLPRGSGFTYCGARHLGAARAAKAAGDAKKARERYGALAELWKDADADLPELAEVKAGAND